ncbi:unnamed protein product [Hyaloperonospora brassicae]|uniref:RCC1-like domain-containing protein n=1 Tax=Hyaloperonospora brassicae TaxID=162125 RepID=A0AAV0UUE3_HYABA|nr:unnamed protein product [Hyaloperonospora brassicae]
MVSPLLYTKESLDLWACARSPELAPDLAQLLQDDAPPNDRNGIGETALHVAATSGNDEAVALLLRYGASLSIADWESGWTPLHRSLYHQRLSTSLLLLRHAQTRFGRSYLHEYLHETRDHAQQSPMQLLSSRLSKKDTGSIVEPDSHGGLVYTFGKSDYQLGYHLPKADVLLTPRLVGIPTSFAIVQVSASKYHTIALNAAGECFAWGFGKGGRLGTGSEFDLVEPTQVMSLSSTPLKKVVAGENHTMALSRTGQVYSWGSNSFGQLGHPGKSSSLQSRLTPKRIEAFRLQVVADIAVSGCHSAAIAADDGAVYSWGSNRRGQLGRKEGCGTDQADGTPRTVDALRPCCPTNVIYGDYDSVRAEKLALSDWHTCVVLRCSRNGRSLGQVWQFGYGSYRPSRVKFSSSAFANNAVMCDTWIPTSKQHDIDILDISCAQNHSIALSASGSVFTWGHNVPALSHQSSGSLRDRHAEPFGNHIAVSPSPSAPQMVQLRKYGPAASVCASQDHCAVVTQQGDLVTWGCGQQGVLGHGRSNTWQPCPKRVAGVKKAIAVAAGHQHSAVLIAPVHPAFSNVADVTSESMVPSLMELVEKKLAACVDITNCVLLWQHAERYAALRLQTYCSRYMQENWDAILDIVGGERMETLFDVMLPPMEEVVKLENAVDVGAPKKYMKEKKAGKQSCASRGTRGRQKHSSCVAQKETDAAAKELDDDCSTVLSTSGKPDERRRSKSTKFVPLQSFLSSKTGTAITRDCKSPWEARASVTLVKEDEMLPARDKCASSASPIFTPGTDALCVDPQAFPEPVASVRKDGTTGTASRQRRTNTGSQRSSSPRVSVSPSPVPGKHVLDHDGNQHKQLTAFSLNLFLKRPARRTTRSEREKPAARTWIESSPEPSAVALEQKSPPPKTLKEIQEEEETFAARERKAKVGLGGGVGQRSQSTINSWGLVRPPGHVSLADVQKLQEEQEFIQQQHQILAEIERERAERARAVAAAAQSKPSAKRRDSGTRKQRRKVGNVASGKDVSSAATSGRANQEKKQKNARERKAAKKAAGGTFAATGKRIVDSTRSAGQERKAGNSAAAQRGGTMAEAEALRPRPSQSRPT